MKNFKIQKSPKNPKIKKKIPKKIPKIQEIQKSPKIRIKSKKKKSKKSLPIHRVLRRTEFCMRSTDTCYLTFGQFHVKGPRKKVKVIFFLNDEMRKKIGPFN